MPLSRRPPTSTNIGRIAVMRRPAVGRPGQGAESRPLFGISGEAKAFRLRLDERARRSRQRGSVYDVSGHVHQATFMPCGTIPSMSATSTPPRKCCFGRASLWGRSGCLMYWIVHGSQAMSRCESDPSMAAGRSGPAVPPARRSTGVRPLLKGHAQPCRQNQATAAYSSCAASTKNHQLFRCQADRDLPNRSST